MRWFYWAQCKSYRPKTYLCVNMYVFQNCHAFVKEKKKSCF